MKTSFNNQYMASGAAGSGSGIVMFGCPLDATSSFRGGTKFAPDSIRRASWTLETYSPYLKADLEEISFEDAGNLELPHGNLAGSLGLIEEAVGEVIQGGRRILIFGGEHLITYPVVKALRQEWKDLQIVHFDAHCDLRDQYEGEKLSHATVMKRVRELGVKEMFQIGIRSGTREEFEELHPVDSPASLASVLKRDVPVYLTFDMDVFDPSLVSGVTTPEPGGLMFREVMEYFSLLKGIKIIGADVVELAPDYDASFVSSVVAAKVARNPYAPQFRQQVNIAGNLSHRRVV